MDILISDLIAKIKEVFDSSKVLSVETVYEKINNSEDLKLVISINKILYDDVNIIYTKLIFVTDNSKSKLTKDNFTYLHDINCEYVRINFTDLEDFSTKISDIFEKNKFGENIKILSNFIKSPSSLINKWFQENGITDLSVINVEEPKISIMPCKSLNFVFKIGLSNNQDVDVEISKEGEKQYIFGFNFLDQNLEVQQANLKNLINSIATNINNIFKNKM